MYIYFFSLSLPLSLFVYSYILRSRSYASYAICRDKIYIKLYGPFLYMGWNCLKARQSQYEETVYL